MLVPEVHIKELGRKVEILFPGIVPDDSPLSACHDKGLEVLLGCPAMDDVILFILCDSF